MKAQIKHNKEKQIPQTTHLEAIVIGSKPCSFIKLASPAERSMVHVMIFCLQSTVLLKLTLECLATAAEAPAPPFWFGRKTLKGGQLVKDLARYGHT